MFFQNGAHLVAGNGIGTAAERYQLHQLHIRLGANVAGSIVHTGLICPLVEHRALFLFQAVGERVLAEDHKAVLRAQFINAMADFRVDMIRAAAQHQNTAALEAGFLDHPLPGGNNAAVPFFIGLISQIHSKTHFGKVDAHLLAEIARTAVLEIFGPVQTHIRRQKSRLFQSRDIGSQQLRVIGHHGAVVVVIADAFVKIIGHAGIKNIIHMFVQQAHNVSVGQLGRIAHRIGRDRALAFYIQIPGGFLRKHHLKIQRSKELKPERQVFVHVQAQGNPHGTPYAAAQSLSLHLAQSRVFQRVQIWRGQLFPAQRTGAAVAGNIAAAAAEFVHGQGAVIGAQLAGGRFGRMLEIRQIRHGKQHRFLDVVIPGRQGRAEGAHQPGNGGAGHIAAQLQFKAAQHSVVQECSALHHNIFAQVICRRSADDLVDGIFHNGNGQACGDVLHRRAVLLRLLHRGIHEHRAPRTQVHRRFCKQAQFGIVGNRVAHGFGKRLDEASAAGRARLVEHNGIHGIVANLETFHILAADVDNVIHIRVKVLRGGKVSHRFHQPQVAAERIFDQLLAVTCHSTASDADAVFALLINPAQLLEHNVNRIALVRTIIGI